MRLTLDNLATPVILPLFGVLWSALYFADAINLQTLLALALILIGIALTRKGS